MAVALLATSPAHSNNLPTCTAVDSDTDGDGYGWENNASCRVVKPEGACEDRGDYPWGWNPVALTSCRLDTAVCVDTVPLNDGWGWNGFSSCRVSVEKDMGRCDDVGLYPWGWNPTTESTCRVELAGATEAILGRLKTQLRNSVQPPLQEVLNVPMLCRKLTNQGYDDGVGFFNDLPSDPNIFYSGTLEYLGDTLRGSYVPEVQSQYRFHQPAAAALNYWTMWQRLDDEPIASFHESGERLISSDGTFLRVNTGTMDFKKLDQNLYVFDETFTSLLGTSQYFQISLCVPR